MFSNPTTPVNNTQSKKVVVGLAPMEGVSDLPLRLWFALTSQPDFCTTPFLRITKDYPAKRIPTNFIPDAHHPALGYTTIPQLMGSDTDHLLPIADTLLHSNPVIDFNCGCPASKVVGHNSGSGLLKSADLFESFVSKLSQELGNKNVSIKMRLGFDHEDEFVNLSQRLEPLRIARLTIHGRTRPDRYLGKSRWAQIQRAAKQHPETKIVGSGDISSWDCLNAKRIACPDVTQMIVGRGALRNPWLFQELRTGLPVSISLVELRFALCTFLVLTDLFHAKYDVLLGMIDNCYFKEPLRNQNDWQNFYHKICFMHYGKEITFDKLEVSVVTMSRLKLIWNYLRSSLPIAFGDGTLMRHSNAQDLMGHIGNLWKIHANCSDSVSPTESNFENFKIELRYQSKYDWIYAGESKNAT